MSPDKKSECKELYRQLKDDMRDLDSVNFRPHWFERAKVLQERGCWYHYNILIRKARDYLAHKGDYNQYCAILIVAGVF